jgi:hypothetical protein
MECVIDTGSAWVGNTSNLPTDYQDVIDFSDDFRAEWQDCVNLKVLCGGTTPDDDETWWEYHEDNQEVPVPDASTWLLPDNEDGFEDWQKSLEPPPAAPNPPQSLKDYLCDHIEAEGMFDTDKDCTDLDDSWPPDSQDSCGLIYEMTVIEGLDDLDDNYDSVCGITKTQTCTDSFWDNWSPSFLPWGPPMDWYLLCWYNAQQ